MVRKGDSEKKAHSEIVQSLIMLAELKDALLKPIMPDTHEKTAVQEVKKVGRRLKLWAKRPSQINTKILNAFLKLKRSGVTVITENDLKNELPEESFFDSNFAQMKIIAEKNHGKIFEHYGDNIHIWEPVASDIREYEKVVFENKLI